MDVALVTRRKSELSILGSALKGRGVELECFADADDLLGVARVRSWSAVIVDGLAAPFRETVERLVEVNASLNTAVITDLEPAAFHDAGEGLGILCALPAQPSAGDVDGFLLRLRSLGGFDAPTDAGLVAAQSRLDAMCRSFHPHCVVCGDHHPFGLKVHYCVTGEHTVEGHFDCSPDYQGYLQVLHGGIVSSLLDGAMVSCLLAKGLEAYTVDLRVRYKAAARTGVPAIIRGAWMKAEGPLHLLEASLEQDGKVCARARAKFFEGSPDHPSQPMPGGGRMRPLLSQARKRLV